MFNMFVDDSLFVRIGSVIEQSTATSIEDLYMILGFPDICIRQDALSLDKYWQSIYSYERIQLDFLITTYTLNVGLSNQKHLLIVDEITNWYKKRYSTDIYTCTANDHITKHMKTKLLLIRYLF